MLRKVKPGDPIKAEDYNRLIDEIQALKSLHGIEKTIKISGRNTLVGPFQINKDGDNVRVSNYNETLIFSGRLPYQLIQAHNGRMFWYDSNQIGYDSFTKKRRSLKDWSYDFTYASSWNGVVYRYILQASASGNLAHLRYRENIFPVNIFNLNPDNNNIGISKSIPCQVKWYNYQRTMTEGNTLTYSNNVSYYILFYSGQFWLDTSIPASPATPCYIVGEFRHDGENGFTFYAVPPEILWAMIYSMYMTTGYSGQAVIPVSGVNYRFFFDNGICYNFTTS